MSSRMGKARGWAAVVFGESALEVITVKPAGNDLNIVVQTSEPLPAAIENQTTAQRFQTTAQALRRRVDLQEHRIVTAIACEEVLCQTLRLPTTTAGELQQMLDLQMDNLTPLPIEEVVYSFEALETTANDTRVLVALARKSVVNERVAALEAAGWKPERVSIDGLAVLRDLLRRGVLPADANLNTLVLISPLAVNFFTFSGGQVLAVRSVLLGSALLSDPGTQLIIEEELNRTLVAAEVERPGLTMGAISFATWTESLRAPLADLAGRWRGSATVLSNGSSPDPVRSLCFESARAEIPQLNLLPAEWRQRRQQARFRQMMIRGGIAVAVVYALAVAAFLVWIGIKSNRLNRLDADLKKGQPQFRETQELRKTLLTMQRLLDTEHSSLEVLREVSRVMPENVKLNGFTFKKDESVKLRAQAQSAGVANDFISRLETSPLFSKVSPEAMRSDPATGLTKFDVVCTLKTAASYGN